MAIALIVFGAACALYGTTIMLVNSGSSFFLVWYVIAAVCLVPGIASLLAPENAAVRMARIAASAITVVFVVATVALSTFIMTADRTETPDDLDYLLVLGAQVRADGTPAEVLRHRLETARNYLADHPETKAIVCGGQGDNEPVSEADCMSAWLVDAGIDSERIIREDRSTTTAENLAFASRLIDPTRDRVGIVTNNFHVYRALQIAEHQGLEHTWGIPAYSTPWYLPNNLLRECFAILKNTLLGTM